MKRDGPDQPRLLEAPATAGDHLAGTVERVTFHNEENGFSVLRVQVRGRRELVTVVGHAAAISAGEFIQATGGWTNDRVHGSQFSAAIADRRWRPRPSRASRSTSDRAW